MFQHLTDAVVSICRCVRLGGRRRASVLLVTAVALVVASIAGALPATARSAAKSGTSAGHAFVPSTLAATSQAASAHNTRSTSSVSDRRRHLVRIVKPHEGKVSTTGVIKVRVVVKRSVHRFRPRLDGKGVKPSFQHRSRRVWVGVLGGTKKLTRGKHRLVVKVRARGGRHDRDVVHFVVRPGGTIPPPGDAVLEYPTGAYLDTMPGLTTDGCAQVKIATAAWPRSSRDVQNACAPGHQAYVAVFSTATMSFQKSTYTDGTHTSLQAFLKTFPGPARTYLVVYTDPAGGADNKGLSAVWRLTNGVTDAANSDWEPTYLESQSGSINDSHQLHDSAPVGQLTGWLMPAGLTDSGTPIPAVQGFSYGFTATDYPAVQTGGASRVEDLAYRIAFSPSSDYFDPSATDLVQLESLSAFGGRVITQSKVSTGAQRTTEQQWRLLPASGGTIQIQNAGTDQCLLTRARDQQSDDDALDEAPCGATDARSSWILHPRDGNTFELESKNGGYLGGNSQGMFTMGGSGGSKYTRLQISSPQVSLGVNPQPQRTGSRGDKSGPTTRTAAATGTLLTGDGGNGEGVTAETARRASDSSSVNQQWMTVPSMQLDGAVKVVNAGTRQCLDVFGGSGTILDTYPCDANGRDGANQLYRLQTSPADNVPGATQLISELTGQKELVVTSHGTGERATLEQSPTPDQGSDPNQRWTLPGSNTMSVGAERLPSFNAATFTGVQITGVDIAGNVVAGTPITFPLGAAAEDPQYLALLARIGSLKRAGDVVMVQTIGRPAPTSAGWNDVAIQLGQLGGQPAVFDTLGGGDADYSLIGCATCADSAVEAGPRLGLSDEDGYVSSAVLHRDAVSGWEPGGGAVDPSGADTGFSELVWRAPGAWPLPQGVSAQDAAAARAYFATELGLTIASCTRQGSQGIDVRNAYCNNAVDWDTERSTLQNNTPWTKDSGVTQVVFDAVKQQLAGDPESTNPAKKDGEFGQLAKLKSWSEAISATNNGSDAAALMSQLQTTSAQILHEISDSGRDGDESTADATALVETALDVASELSELAGPEVTAGLYILEGLTTIAEAHSNNTDGESALEEVSRSGSQIVNALVQSVKTLYGSFGTAQDLIAQDSTKLAAASENSAWTQQTTPQKTATQTALALGATKEMYRELLPVYYQRWDIYYQGSKSLDEYHCREKQEVPVAPLTNQPDSAAYAPNTGIDSIGRPIAGNEWVLGRADHIDDVISSNHSQSAFISPPSSLTDPFRSAGLWLFTRPSWTTKDGKTDSNGDACSYWQH